MARIDEPSIGIAFCAEVLSAALTGLVGIVDLPSRTLFA
jgi:hypothetical protein